jgi:hypothetical protein
VAAVQRRAKLTSRAKARRQLRDNGVDWPLAATLPAQLQPLPIAPSTSRGNHPKTRCDATMAESCLTVLASATQQASPQAQTITRRRRIVRAQSSWVPLAWTRMSTSEPRRTTARSHHASGIRFCDAQQQKQLGAAKKHKRAAMALRGRGGFFETNTSPQFDSITEKALAEDAVVSGRLRASRLPRNGKSRRQLRPPSDWLAHTHSRVPDPGGRRAGWEPLIGQLAAPLCLQNAAPGAVAGAGGRWMAG